MISASALPRLLACVGGEVLPRIHTSSAHADAGVARHAAYEAAALAGDIASLPERVQTLIDDDMELLPEYAIAYDTNSGAVRALGQGLERGYGALADDEIPGTLDLVAIGPERVLVVDFKGFLPVDATAQIMFGALAMSKLLGRDVIETAIIPEMGSAVRATYDTFDLAAFAARLKTLRPKIERQRERVGAGEQPDVSAGSWCRHCPARMACPTTTAAIRTIEANPDRGPVTGEEMTRLYQLTRRVSAWLADANAAIYGYTEDYAIDLGDGRIYGRRPTKGRESLDGDIAYTVIRELHGQDIADAAVARDASKKSINEALGLVAGKGQIKRTVDAALEAIRARGGITTGAPGWKREEHAAALPGEKDDAA